MISARFRQSENGPRLSPWFHFHGEKVYTPVNRNTVIRISFKVSQKVYLIRESRAVNVSTIYEY